MADLISLAELRTALGIDPTDTRDDGKYTLLLPFVSDTIRAFTGRDFGSPNVTETRTYEYDGSGVLDIDDASAITAVLVTYPNTGVADVTLPLTDWTPKPERRDDSLVYQYIHMPGYAGGAGYGSPEMGFTRNLDVYVAERGYSSYAPKVKVTGTFGWPAVPGDVKMATIWTLQEWVSRPSGEGLTSESIESYSRAWGGRSGAAAAMAIPARSRDILAQYTSVLA